jgi:hypothetical protein
MKNNKLFLYTDHIPCPCDWEKILNSCSDLFVKNNVTWDTARADCLKRGGDLVIPTSTTECDLLSQRASNLELRIPWIGLFRYTLIINTVHKESYPTLILILFHPINFKLLAFKNIFSVWLQSKSHFSALGNLMQSYYYMGVKIILILVAIKTVCGRVEMYG